MKCLDSKRAILYVAVFLGALLLALGGASAEGLAMNQPSQPQEQPAAAAASPSPHVWIGPEGQALPFKSDEEIVEFLRAAKVKKYKELGQGITRPIKAMLEKDGVRANAHFQSINMDKPGKTELASGKVEFGFRDSYLFDLAAYELNKMLGLNTIPPMVERKLDGKSGRFQIWVEGVTTREDMRAKNIEPADQRYWNEQMYRIHVFDALVENTDPNLGNFLIDKDGRVWTIDYSRAFRRDAHIAELDNLQHCERGLLEKLRTLDEGAVRTQLKSYLRGGEIDAMLKRRQELVAHFDKLVQERGEGAVLYVLNQ